jgi:hypothetical protein
LLWFVPELAHQAIDSLKKMRDDPKERHPLSWEFDRWIDWLQGEGRKEEHERWYNRTGDHSRLESWYKGIVLMDRKRGTNLTESVPLLTPLFQYAQEQFGPVEDLT